MIHTAYFHGDDQPATELSPRQIQAAGRDHASVLWIDLDRASAAEAERTIAAFGVRPNWLALTELDADAGRGDVGGPLEVWAHGSMLATRHAHASAVIQQLAARVEPLGGTIEGGVGTLLVILGDVLAESYTSAMQPTSAPLGGQAQALRTGAIEHAAAQAAAAFQALEADIVRQGGTVGEGLALVTARLSDLAKSAAVDADTAEGFAATTGLSDAIAAATRQLRLTQFIMLGALGLLAIIALLLWQIAGALG